MKKGSKQGGVPLMGAMKKTKFTSTKSGKSGKVKGNATIGVKKESMSLGKLLKLLKTKIK